MSSRYSYFGARVLDDSEQCEESDLLSPALFTRSKHIYKQGLHFRVGAATPADDRSLFRQSKSHLFAPEVFGNFRLKFPIH
ncbi:hypothetical protein CEXT_236461 [Caerostris extrusa]|uniref:Uncharacterized protein n=1 Tax=Caerostris extrusa TaxID=172846 RepID=A0AAV4RZX5_CAEEX|nr:hypothetical protein CEXT_236461 [Caerostris extrusa]